MVERVRGTMWSFTINNPSEQELASIRHPNLPTFVISISHQQEVGESGTLHVQGAIRTTQKDFTVLHKYMPRAHLEICRNESALMNYVKKMKTAIKGTQYQHPPIGDVPATAKIEDDTPPPALRLEVIDVLKIIVRSAPFLTIEDEIALNFHDDWKKFKYIVNYACRETPGLIHKCTAPNLFHNFKLFYEVLRDFVLEEDLPEPVDRQTEEETVVPGEYLILDD